MPRTDEHHDERYEDGDAVESPYPDWDAYADDLLTRIIARGLERARAWLYI